MLILQQRFEQAGQPHLTDKYAIRPEIGIKFITWAKINPVWVYFSSGAPNSRGMGKIWRGSGEDLGHTVGEKGLRSWVCVGCPKGC